MWTRERHHMVYTEPWVYVAMPGQEIEYMQMHEPASAPRRVSVVRQVWRLYVCLKRLTLL